MVEACEAVVPLVALDLVEAIDGEGLGGDGWAETVCVAELLTPVTVGTKFRLPAAPGVPLAEWATIVGDG